MYFLTKLHEVTDKEKEKGWIFSCLTFLLSFTFLVPVCLSCSLLPSILSLTTYTDKSLIMMSYDDDEPHKRELEVSFGVQGSKMFC